MYQIAKLTWEAASVLLRTKGDAPSSELGQKRPLSLVKPRTLRFRSMNDLTNTFRELEESLWRGSTSDRDSILSDEFTEFCRFGDVYDRDHLLQDNGQSPSVEFPFDPFNVEILSEDVALVTYENRVNGERARRSSIWVDGPNGWQLRFMQATTLED